MSWNSLRGKIEKLAAEDAPSAVAVQPVVAELIEALESGELRAAEPHENGWRVHPWVKTGILLGFKHSPMQRSPAWGDQNFVDKQWYLTRDPSAIAGVRVVPGGSAVRRGSHIGAGTVLMPPCYVNVGAFVGEGSMIDSHALVGSCAQIGAGVHLSAGAQVGGVLEPPGALPVIVEDHAFVGGLAAVFEGVRVRSRAVIGAGVVLTRSTPVYDVAQRQRIAPTPDGVLEIPPGAVVVPGSRPHSDAWSREQGLSVACALIVKHRDEKTDARAALEGALR